MKTSIIITLILFLFSLSETNAQQSDTLQNIQVMKRDSKRFIAIIKTEYGITNGLLYSADSTEIVLLDYRYRKNSYPISSIKSLEIIRVNAFGFGFKHPFLVFSGAAGISAIGFLLSGAYTGGWGSSLAGLAATVIPLGLLGAGIITGLVFGLVSTNISHTKMSKFVDVKYFKQLKYIKHTSQEYIIKHFPNSPRISINQF